MDPQALELALIVRLGQERFQVSKMARPKCLIQSRLGVETRLVPVGGNQWFTGEERADRRIGDRLSLILAVRHQVKKRPDRRAGDIDTAILKVIERHAALGTDDVIEAVDEVVHRLQLRPQHVLAEHGICRREDPTEKGLRKILNWGHTLGHAVETFLLDQGKRKILHGEAIACGMIMEAFLSYARGLIGLSDLESIETYLFETYGRVVLKEDEIPAILKLTAQDKKNKGSEIRFSLLTGLGDCGYDIPVSKSEMKKAIEYYIG